MRSRSSGDESSIIHHNAFFIYDQNIEISFVHANPQRKPQDEDFIAPIQTKPSEHQQLPK